MIPLEDRGNGIFTATGPVICFGSEEIAFVRAQAELNPRRRARICAHSDETDPLHEMLIALCADSYIQPHRHNGKSESFHLVEGQADVLLFDDLGSVRRIIPLGLPAEGRILFYRLASNWYHTFIIHSPMLIIHETTNGPFQPSQSEKAPFAPDDSNVALYLEYMRKLRNMCTVE